MQGTLIWMKLTRDRENPASDDAHSIEPARCDIPPRPAARFA